MRFERGFKTRCENISESVRRDMGLRPSEPLPMEQLARYLDVRLLDPRSIPGMSETALRTLLQDDTGDWSALTISENGAVAVIYNPQHSIRRRSSDLAHEFSHLILRHAPSTMMFAPDGTWTLRSFNEQQEDEAGWLSGCLLLPRPAVYHIAKRVRDFERAASIYVVSKQLLRYRTNTTGVSRQLGAGR